MKRLRLAALLIGLSPTLAPGAVKNATKALISEVSDTDIPVTVGIEADLPYVTPGGKLGHWGVGNGGDWMRINFARARDYAANVVLRINPSSLSRLKDDSIRQWILTNQKFLAADILQTEHVWVTEAKPTCAFTVPPGADGKIPTSNPIEFSYPTCRTQLKCAGDATPTDPNAPIDFLEVAQLLIHEATHHFNADESTADKIAITIIDAWQSGLMDSIPLGLTNAPVSSQKHSAVWTGDRMVVVGGFQDETTSYLRTVSSYDPTSGTWTDITPPQNFSFTARGQAHVAWTGKEVLVWGGFTQTGSTTKWLFDGALYNPATNTWRAIPAAPWSTPKTTTVVDYPWQTLVWTGEKAIIWGGYDASNNPLGGIYDPNTNTWTKMSVDATAPRVQEGHSAVWTGDSMIVWGGYSTGSQVTDYGAIYYPATNTWKAIATGSANGAPSARAGHQVAWTGSQMVVISGGGSGTSTDLASTGGLYNPSTNTWTSYKSELMIERFGHRLVWNGEEVLVIGGQSKRLATYFGEVYAFNPATLRWRILPGSVIPPPRSFSSIVWTGSSALVWGGYAGNSKTQRSGAQYFP